MIKYLFRKNKDYSRYNIIKTLLYDFECSKNIFILLPFSKNQFIKNFSKKATIVNDFFISNYDTYVYDRKKITKYNPRAWWKFFQDWINFRFSKYLLSDTQEHFEYWENLFGKYKGHHFVLPVLADKTIYFPNNLEVINSKIKILFYGSFIPLHGIDKILHAFKILETSNIQFEAEIIGTGQIYPKMKKLYDTLQLKNVVMNGKIIKEQELAEIIRNSDIILGIFGDSKKAKSVVPNKAYQALASKKVLVTMHSDAIKEFFTKEEIVFCDNMPTNIASTIKSLILNKDLIKTYSENGYYKFLNLYEISKVNFRNFLKDIDNEEK